MTLLAQAIPEGIPGNLMQIGTIGISVWFVWYVTSFLLPKMHKDNSDLIAKVNKDNNDMIIRIVSDFRDEMRLERESHTQQMVAQRDECRREAGLLMQSFQLQLKSSGVQTSDSTILKNSALHQQGT